MIDVKVKILDTSIDKPVYAHFGDAGLDLRSSVDCVIAPQERVVVPTGLAFEIPSGFAGLVVPRSGLAAKHGITIVNAPGLIDSGYRGEIKVILLNTSVDESFVVNKNDRIAQIMFTPYEHAVLTEVDVLDDSERSENGFGSSGVE